MRRSQSESLVPIPNCKVDDITYNTLGVRVLAARPGPDAVTILYFSGGRQATEPGAADSSAAAIMQKRLEDLLKRPVRVIDGSYETFFAGEPSVPLEQLLKTYKPRFTVVAFHGGVQIVKAIEMNLIDSGKYNFDFVEDPSLRRFGRFIAYTRALSFAPYPQVRVLEPYLKTLKSYESLSRQYGSEFRFMWNGTAVNQRSWRFWIQNRPLTLTERLLEPLLEPVIVDRETFEAAIAASGIAYRWVDPPKRKILEDDENVSAQSFGDNVANNLFVRETWPAPRGR